MSVKSIKIANCHKSMQKSTKVRRDRELRNLLSGQINLSKDPHSVTSSNKGSVTGSPGKYSPSKQGKKSSNDLLNQYLNNCNKQRSNKSLLKIDSMLNAIQPYWKESRSNSKSAHRRALANNSLNVFKELKHNLSQKKDPVFKFIKPRFVSQEKGKGIVKSNSSLNLRQKFNSRYGAGHLKQDSHAEGKFQIVIIL